MAKSCSGVRHSSAMEGDHAWERAEVLDEKLVAKVHDEVSHAWEQWQVSPWQRCSCRCLLSQQHLSAHLPFLRCSSVQEEGGSVRCS